MHHDLASKWCLVHHTPYGAHTHHPSTLRDPGHEFAHADPWSVDHTKLVVKSTIFRRLVGRSHAPHTQGSRSHVAGPRSLVLGHWSLVLGRRSRVQCKHQDDGDRCAIYETTACSLPAPSFPWWGRGPEQPVCLHLDPICSFVWLIISFNGEIGLVWQIWFSLSVHRHDTHRPQKYGSKCGYEEPEAPFRCGNWMQLTN